MEFLKTALFITLLTATSARTVGWRQHQDADIADKDWTPDVNSRWVSRSSESFSREDSSESSESRSSEDSSSEEVLVTEVTTPTTGDAGDGSTLAPEPATPGPVEPTVMETVTPKVGNQSTAATPGTGETTVMETVTPKAGNQSTAATPATPPCDQCFTVEIPTTAPITNNRGDN